MTHFYNTSVTKNYRHFSTSYIVEVEDYDNEITSFNVDAYSIEDANAKGTELAQSYGIDIYNMNIYKY